MSNITDLQNWLSQGLPAAAHWNVTGFNAKWHADQVRAGRRLLPSVYLPLNGPPGWNTSNDPATIKNFVTAFAADIKYLSDNQVPICIRANNIADQFTDSRSLLPVDPSSIPNSVRVWAMKSTGLAQRDLADTFGPDAAWFTEGVTLGQSKYLAALAAIYQSPPWVQFIENNEGTYDDYNMYAVSGQTNAFQPASTVNAMSIRMADYLTANPAVTPSVFAETFYANRKSKWQNFYSGLESAVPQGWQGKTQRVAYSAANLAVGAVTSKMPDPNKLGYAPEGLCYDSNSPGHYIQGTQMPDFTNIVQAQALNRIPMWEWIEINNPNPRHHREFSLKLTGSAAIIGAKAGKHLVITPAIWEGLCHWLFWATHQCGVASMLRPWNGSTTKPTDSFWDAAQVTYLQSAGASPQVMALTEGDYAIAPATAADAICSDLHLRRFWDNSQPVVNHVTTPTDIYLSKFFPGQKFPLPSMPNDYFRLLDVDCNTPSSQWKWDGTTNSVSGTIKVWATARRACDGVVLLFAYSPCAMSGNVTVTIPGTGDVVINAPQPWGYWLVSNGKATQLPISTNLVVQ